jgi:alkylation response protein AidB-like acyl-CoA dehydrogenase
MQHLPRQVLRRHSELGYMAVSVYPLAAQYLEGQRLPADIKPHEWDGFHDLVVIDEIARCGYLGVIWALSCGNSIGAPPLVNFGTPKQKKDFLPGILNGKTRFCLGVTEPDGMFQLSLNQWV